jgi:hypothetical protein
MKETEDAVVTELLETLGHLKDGGLVVGTRLGVELVGIADELLLEGLRDEEALGDKMGRQQRRTVLAGRYGGEACTGMALADASMTLVALTAQQFAANKAVAQVVLAALAEDAWGVTPADADVVEHGRLLEELHVDSELGTATDYEQAAVGHLTGM